MLYVPSVFSVMSLLMGRTKREFPWQEACCLVVLENYLAVWIEGGASNGWKSDRSWILSKWCDTLRCVKSSENLLVGVAILF